MDDAAPSATPMPEQPVAAVTNPEAPSPPAAPPLPVFMPPSVTDPVSNLDFLPVDDAFALELRSETIEQLVGGDALRRGVSERIEAGRSHTNAEPASPERISPTTSTWPSNASTEQPCANSRFSAGRSTICRGVHPAWPLRSKRTPSFRKRPAKPTMIAISRCW